MQRLILAILPVLVLVGCAEKRMDDLDNFIEDVKLRTPPPIAPIPEIKRVETFLYEPGDRRDPFSRRFDSEDSPSPIIRTGPKPDPNRRREELESYPLDSLRMVGSLLQDGERWALIEAPTGIIHRITKGNYLGTNYGRVTNVSETRLELIELEPASEGTYTEREAAIAMSET